MLRVFLFGAPHIEQQGQAVSLRRSKALALLAYLALTRRPQDREALLALLWPEFDAASARNNLRRELSLLKSTLGEELLLADRFQVVWNNQAGTWLDVVAFQSAIKQQHRHPDNALCDTCAAALTTAVQLYTDDFLAGFSLPESPAFDEWQFFQREELRQQLAGALQALIGWQIEQAHYGAAITFARRWLALDPLHEPAQRELMRLYAWSGQQSAALRQYEECVRLLSQELGAQPEAETTALVEAIRARQLASPRAAEAPAAPGDAGLLDGAAPAPLDLAIVQHLPPQVSPLIGRERELGEVVGYLRDSTCRLLTLSGTGGIGKTRLAQAAAQALAADCAQGAYFVGLTPVGDPQLIAPAILAALNIPLLGTAEPRAQLLAHLREKHMLVLLDNFEHLLEGAELLSEIIAAAPRVLLLVTSRERLNLPEEWSYQVPGMEYPGSEGQASAGDSRATEAYDAVHLFLTYARRAQASFAPQAGDMAQIVRICRLLDGMPLGLELAAPWVQSMSCREIADEIARDLDFLSTTQRHLPERHRNLRAVYGHAWERLSPIEQIALQQLSVFLGGWTRDAAEQVAGATLPILQTLASKALVRRSVGGRYDMHELVRQFAYEQLQSGQAEYERVRELHCSYYVAFLQQHTEGVRSGRRPEAAREVAADRDNISAAWRWAVARQDLAKLWQAVACLWEFYKLGSARMGEEVFQQALQALDRPGGAVAAQGLADRKALLGTMLVAQGNLMARRGAPPEGYELMVRGIARMRQAVHPEAHQIAVAVIALGAVSVMTGNYQKVRECATTTLPYFVEINDLWGIASCFLQLGIVAFETGHLAEANYFLTESVAACRRDDIRSERHFANFYLTRLALAQGEYLKASQFITENMQINGEINNIAAKLVALRQQAMLGIAQGELDAAAGYLEQYFAMRRENGQQSWESLGLLGCVHRLRGDYDQARAVLLQGLAAAQSIGTQLTMASSLVELGHLAVDCGDLEQAERFYREALAIWQQQGGEPETAQVLCAIGHVLLLQSRTREAEVRRSYQDALRIAIRHRLVPLVMDVCVGVARLQLELGIGDRAAKLLALAIQHPASTYETNMCARRQLARCPTTVDTSSTSAAPLDWQALAEQLIAELADSTFEARPSIRHNLPPPVTPLVGREQELASLQKYLGSAHQRLITIAGPGGIGKTRLALGVAEAFLGTPAAAARAADGVFFVPLAALNSAEQMIPAIADTLGLHLESSGSPGRSPLRQVVDYLRPMQLLLLLDNFEHLGEGAGLLSQLLADAPAIKLLVTSREALNLAEEWLLPIAGLAVPRDDRRPTTDDRPRARDERQETRDERQETRDRRRETGDERQETGDNGQLSVDELEHYDAVRLFVERARQVSPTFSLNTHGAAVARICRLVEGMPLAIELAAAWAKTMTCAAIADEIARNLTFLEARSQHQPERHRSMRATFDQSWARLDATERMAFMRLSIFRSSFTPAAAKAVLSVELGAASVDQLKTQNSKLITLLSALVDKSLLHVEPGGRYHMHELLRQYAEAQLQTDAAAARQAQHDHDAFYAALLAEHFPALLGHGQARAIDAIAVEIENIRVAWPRAVEQSPLDALDPAVYALSLYYDFRGFHLESTTLHAVVDARLRRTPPSPQRDRMLAVALTYKGWSDIRVGRHSEARADFEESEALHARLNIPPQPGYATEPLVGLGILAQIQGEYADAARLGAAARQRNEALRHPNNTYSIFYLLTNAALAQGQIEAAQRYAQQSYASAQASGDDWFLAYCLNELGNVARARGAYDEARQHYAASYAVRAAFHNPEGMALSLALQGQVGLLQAAYADAHQQYQRSTAIYRQVGDRGGLATALNGLGRAECALGAYDAAGAALDEALQIAVEIDYISRALVIIASIGELLLYTRWPAVAAELLILVIHHPGSDTETCDMAKGLLQRCEALLAPEALALAAQRAQAHTIDSIAARFKGRLSGALLDGLLAAFAAEQIQVPAAQHPRAIR